MSFIESAAAARDAADYDITFLYRLKEEGATRWVHTTHDSRLLPL